MSRSNGEAMCILDKIRLESGTKYLKEYFERLALEKREEAVKLINDENLNFCSIFVLEPEIEKNNMMSELNSRNYNALNIAKLADNREYSRFEGLLAGKSQEMFQTLKWILETGRFDDGLNSKYSQIMDIAAILLVKKYRSKSSLDTIADMIFIRNRVGLNIHDLVWALFESGDPSCLLLIARGFLSGHPRDFSLSKRLLSFISISDKDEIESGIKRYIFLNNWLSENRMFLYYTGESMQLTGMPVPYAVCLEAKYLHKPVSVDTGKIALPLSEWEQELIESLKGIDRSSREVLSNYSYKLAVQNPHIWKQWLALPISVQKKTAEEKMEGLA
jgi:hypothetical protein